MKKIWKWMTALVGHAQLNKLFNQNNKNESKS